LYRVDEPARALAHQRQVRAPLNAVQHRLQAELLADMGDYAAAVEAYDRALALEPDPDAARLTRFGLNNRAAGRLDRAEELLRQALAQAPEDVFTLYQLARVLHQQERHAEALEHAESAARLSPDDAPLLASLAQISAALGQPDPSAAYRQQALSALSAEPSYAQVHTLALLGLKDEALADLKDLLRDNPGLRRWAPHDPDLRHLRGEIEALVKSAVS
jgi:tetratricopeptide (TPR) repeat protein